MKTHTSTFLTTGILSLLTTNIWAAEDATDTLVNIQLNQDLLNEVTLALPERQNVNQDFLQWKYNPNIILQEDAHVAVTFLDEGAGYRNSLGFFTFESTTFEDLNFGDIDLDSSGHIGISELQNVSGVTTGMVFNNASESGGGGSLFAGDTVTLTGADIINVQGDQFDMSGGQRFDAGTNVGFFLIQNAWDGSQVRGWDYTTSDPITLFSVDFLNPENNNSATIGNVDDYSRHVAMMNSDSGNNEVILGFEDLVRPMGDNDFNDAVFLVRTDPVESLFAKVPTTNQVISLQAAPGPSLGSGLASLLLLGWGVSRRLRQPS